MFQDDKTLLATARAMFLVEHRCSCRRVSPDARVKKSFVVLHCQCGFVTSFEITTVASMRRRARNDNTSLVTTVRKILEPQQPEKRERKPRWTMAA